MVSKQSVLVINVLDPGEMVREKDLKKFDKGKICYGTATGSDYFQNGNACGLLPVSSGEKVQYKPQSGDRQLGTQGSFSAQGQ